MLLLFNWFGYKLVLNYLQQRADLQLEARIDIHDYDESQLIEIRTPLQLPYQSDWLQFERCYGEIEINGKHYTYVKRKIQDGYMILKCLPNRQKEVIQGAESDIVKASQGIDHQNEKASSLFVKAIKCYIGDFDEEKFNSVTDPLTLHHRRYFTSPVLLILKGFIRSSEQPPDSSLYV